MKTCSKCKVTKDESCFYMKRGMPRSECKQCEKQRSMIWAKNNPIKASAFKLAWQKRNPDKRWHKTHPEKCKEAMRRRYQRNKEAYTEAVRVYRRTMEGWATAVLSTLKRSSIARGHKPPCFESREELLCWAKAQPSFFIIWNLWEFAGYSKLTKPSIDRLDNTVGYEWGNMRLVTWRENSEAWTSSERHKENFRNAQKKNPNHIKHHQNS